MGGGEPPWSSSSALYPEAAAESQQGDAIFPARAFALRGPTTCFLPTGFSFPAKTPGCPTAGLAGGEGREGGNGRPKGYGGGVEAGMREVGKSVLGALGRDLSPFPPPPVGVRPPGPRSLCCWVKFSRFGLKSGGWGGGGCGDPTGPVGVDMRENSQGLVLLPPPPLPIHALCPCIWGHRCVSWVFLGPALRSFPFSYSLSFPFLPSPLPPDHTVCK